MTGKTRNDKDQGAADSGESGGLRLDKWLWQARFFKTRGLAGTIATKGKVRVNRMVVTKPHYKVRPGDVLTFAQGDDIRVVRVVALGERRGPAPEARTLYEDIAEPAADQATEASHASSRGPDQPSKKVEPWGGRDGIDPRRARKQAIDAKMNSR